jgi:hypothetical protein
MARLFETGFEQQSLAIGDITPLGGNFSGISPATRGSWSLVGYNVSGGMISFGASVSDFYFGHGFLAQTSGFKHDLAFYSPNGTSNIELVFNAANKLEYKLGRDGTVLATSTTILTAGVWYYIEGHIVIHDTTGSLELRINEVVESSMSVSGIDTRNDAAANGDKCDRFYMGDGGTQLDDIYINDTTGSVNNGYSGDIAVIGVAPNAAGDNTGLTRGGADSGSNWGQVDEIPPNDATDYVFGTDTSSYDLYNLPAVSSILATVQSVRLWTKAQKSGAGSASLAHVVKYDTDASGTADTEAVGSDVALSTGWAYYAKEYDQQPDATNWSPAKVDALQVGVKSR